MSDDFGPWSVVRASLHGDTSGHDWPMLRLDDGPIWVNALTGAQFHRADFDVIDVLNPAP